MHAEVLQRAHGGADAGERRLTHVLDEDVLRRRRSALHAVEHDDIGAGLHRERGVVIGTGAADLHIDRLLPVGDLTKFEDLDFEIVRTRPVGMAAGGTLIDALGQRPHFRHAVGNLLTEQHAAAAGLGALSNDNLDRIRATQIARIHAVARRQILVHERLRVATLLFGHAAVAGCGGGSGERGAAAERFLGRRRKRAEAHAGDGDRNLQFDRLPREARAELHRSIAALAISLERIARDRGAEKQQVVEMRHLALGSGAANIVDAGGGGAADFGERGVVEGRGLTGRRRRILVGHCVPRRLSRRRRCRY